MALICFHMWKAVDVGLESLADMVWVKWLMRPRTCASNGATSVLCYRLGCEQGSYSAGTPGNGIPKVILTVGTAFKPAVGELYKKHSACGKICLFRNQNRKKISGKGAQHSEEKDNPSPCPTPFCASILALKLSILRLLFGKRSLGVGVPASELSVYSACRKDI